MPSLPIEKYMELKMYCINLDLKISVLVEVFVRHLSAHQYLGQGLNDQRKSQCPAQKSLLSSNDE